MARTIYLNCLASLMKLIDGQLVSRRKSKLKIQSKEKNMKAICGFLGIIFILASCYLGGFWFGYHKSYPEDVWGFLILGQSLGLFSGGVMLLAFAKFLFGKEVKQKE